MPIIQPPNDNEWEEIDEIEENLQVDISEFQRIKSYMDIPPWICPNCGLKNFGHNKTCANFRCMRPR